jgi:peroxiredoxin Q/BCP
MQLLTYIQDHIWLILFFAWGLPLSFYRSKFRKLVYNTDHWVINLKPIFIKEIRVLLNLSPPSNAAIKAYRNFYRFYLIIYMLLFLSYLILS